jgi:uncharacterized membrane protein
MRRRMSRTNLFRVFISGLVAAVGTVALLIVLIAVAGVEFNEPGQLSVIAYGVAWPLNVGLYVTWSYRVYSRLGSASLKQATVVDDRDDEQPLLRALGLTGTTNTTITAAVIAVIVTIVVAQKPEFRGEAIYVAMTLLTVASSWVLMVFSFAQSYLRLGAGTKEGSPFRFQFPETARFSDYFTLALMISASAALVSAEINSRAAWRAVRTNIVIAFIFNSVIVAMMVSLLFGRLLG